MFNFLRNGAINEKPECPNNARAAQAISRRGRYCRRLADSPRISGEPILSGRFIQTTQPTPFSSWQRKLGKLEVSAIGLGVQNMSRKYDTSVPWRPR